MEIASAVAEIAHFGIKMVDAGMTSSRFGNISLLLGKEIAITRTGSMLDEITADQVIVVDLSGPCPRDAVASTETCVHRAIYQLTQAKAVIHTHSPYAVAASLLSDLSIEPVDGEGLHFLGSMPIVTGDFGTEDLARNVSRALAGHKACVARGHGVFAAGRNLTDAYTVAAMAEHSSQVKYLVDLAGACRASRATGT